MVTHTHIHTHTHDNYYNPRCAHAHQGLIKGTRFLVKGTISSGAQLGIVVSPIYIRSYVVHVPFTRALRANVGPAG